MAPTEVLYRDLTAQQRRLLALIREWYNAYGYAPTVRELTAALGLASPSTTHSHLVNLRNLGLVDWHRGNNRTLHLTLQGAIVTP